MTNKKISIIEIALKRHSVFDDQQGGVVLTVLPASKRGQPFFKLWLSGFSFSGCPGLVSFLEVKVNGSMPTKRQIRLERIILKDGVSNIGYSAPVYIKLNAPIRMEMMRILNHSFVAEPRHKSNE